MDATEYAAKRRIVAEAMGWRVDYSNSEVVEHPLGGTVYVCAGQWWRHAECGTDVRDNAPDFLADPAAAWALEDFLLAQGCSITMGGCPGGVIVSIRGREHTASEDSICRMRALFIAAAAWVEAKRAKEAARG